MKKVTRLTESELYAIISESVNRILNECVSEKDKKQKNIKSRKQKK